jgi:cytochrome P450
MGVHKCVGQPLARLEAEVVLQALAQRVHQIDLAGEPAPELNNTPKGWARPGPPDLRIRRAGDTSVGRKPE